MRKLVKAKYRYLLRRRQALRCGATHSSDFVIVIVGHDDSCCSIPPNIELAIKTRASRGRASPLRMLVSAIAVRSFMAISSSLAADCSARV